MSRLLKVSSLSVLAVLYSANAWARPCMDGSPDNYSPGYYTSNCYDPAEICLPGHYCPNSGEAWEQVMNLESCPSNYDNTATGLKSIEECCLLGYDSATGLCKIAAIYNDTISGQCQVDFLGSSDGIAVNSFLAQYTPNNYTVSAGQYLEGGAITGTQCPANSWCAGGTFTFSEDNDQGMENCPSDFALSAVGTISIDNCYHTCEVSDVINGTKLSGIPTGNVYQDGRNQCVGTCQTGYIFKVSGSRVNPLSGKESINSDSLQYKNPDDSGNNSDGDLNVGEFKNMFSYGILKGQALCATNRTTNDYEMGIPEGTKGRYCWCRLTNYTQTGGTLQSLLSAWVFDSELGNVDGCAHYCANNCAYDLGKFVFRNVLFESLDAPACEANEITVTWDQANGQGSVTNTCTYDGDITLPTAPTKTGYTFSGWKLVTK